ncbi:MAG: DUF2062 domain-containing protein [Deltaproteobacteria bacterium]|nr:DUF2062 domain-containing protein [Deltaproteobacteria bacterium]
MKFHRQIKYYFLKFIRLKGEPHELAMGTALGIFTGMMPVMPFQIALAVMLALFFRASKITAAIGTWISNPLNWYFLYFWNYKLGAFLLGLPAQSKMFSSVMASIRSGDEPMVIVGKILSAGGASLAAFLLGGLVMGLAASIPAYFVFLHFFKFMKIWRKSRKERRKFPPSIE